jgi:hypothetical protein
MTPTHFGLFASTMGGTNAMAASFGPFRVFDSDTSA